MADYYDGLRRKDCSGCEVLCRTLHRTINKKTVVVRKFKAAQASNERLVLELGRVQHLPRIGGLRKRALTPDEREMVDAVMRKRRFPFSHVGESLQHART